MDVWAAWAVRPVKCLWCPHSIKHGEMMLITKSSKMSTNPNFTGRMFTQRGHYHLECYLAQAKDYLENHPMIPSNPHGRPHIKGLDEEQRKQRHKLLLRGSFLQQQKRRLTTPYPARWEHEQRINIKIAEVALDLIPLGGVPDGWKNSLILSRRPDEPTCEMDRAIREAEEHGLQ